MAFNPFKDWKSVTLVNFTKVIYLVVPVCTGYNYSYSDLLGIVYFL